MSFISSFEIIRVVVPEPSLFLFFFLIPALIAEAAAVIPVEPKYFFPMELLLSLMDLLIYLIVNLDNFMSVEIFFFKCIS